MLPLQILDVATSALTTSSDAYELCRNFVHSDIAADKTIGAQIFSIDQRGYLRDIASYGRTATPHIELNLWDATELTTAVNAKKISNYLEGDLYVTVIPFYKHNAPVGGLLLFSQSNPNENKFDEYTESILAKWGAFYLETNGLQARSTAGPSSLQNEELTPRQVDILAMMATGMTNAEIAKALLLSESTIRQETVRIYKSLGVQSRIEAGKKGKALGLIPRSGGGNSP